MPDTTKHNYKQKIIECLEKANETQLERLWYFISAYLL